MTPRDLPGNMAAHVRIQGGCWQWTGAIQSKGYGSCTDGTGKSTLAHRRAYSFLRGSIPEGMTIDHLCRNKACVNPEHLEVVSRSENVRRASDAQTECFRGHPLSGDNLREYTRPSGYRQRVCVECRRAYSRARYQASRSARQLEQASR